jgi:hypothetical protein
MITAETLLAVTPIVCARCHPDIARFPGGRDATAADYTARLYPWPPGRGTLWCPVHSPPELETFLAIMTTKLRLGWRPPEMKSTRRRRRRR